MTGTRYQHGQELRRGELRKLACETLAMRFEETSLVVKKGVVPLSPDFKRGTVLCASGPTNEPQSKASDLQPPLKATPLLAGSCCISSQSDFVFLTANRWNKPVAALHFLWEKGQEQHGQGNICRQCHMMAHI